MHAKRRSRQVLTLLLWLAFILLLSRPGHARIDGAVSKNEGHPLQSFYSDNPLLDFMVERIVDELSYRDLIGQLIVISCGAGGRPYDEVEKLIRSGQAGGVMFLGAGTDEIGEYVRELTNASREGLLLPLFSIDGEPLLFHERIVDRDPIPGADHVTSAEQAEEIALYITLVLRQLGIHVNYAPVVDLAFNRSVIGRRSFGTERDVVSELSEIFIGTMQKNGIVATAKHFPGHGSVEGDSHTKLLFVQGAPPELQVFYNVIRGGVISVMAGHIGVQSSDGYDTNGYPASLSRSMITGLLKGGLAFRGIVVSDALNMGALAGYDIPGVHALRAGCDMVLMPEDVDAVIDRVRHEIGQDESFRKQILDSVRKVIRLKLTLGLYDEKKLENFVRLDDIY